MCLTHTTLCHCLQIKLACTLTHLTLTYTASAGITDIPLIYKKNDHCFETILSVTQAVKLLITCLIALLMFILPLLHSNLISLVKCKTSVWLHWFQI